jgi:hypothetical protein
VELQNKLIEDRDAAHAESQERAERGDHQEERLPEPVTEAVRDASLERRAQLLGAIRMILAHQKLQIGQLRLPVREREALAALQSAVEGKSADLGDFVFASDRRDLLEGALAVLQPDLTHADDRTARELQVQFADLTERVGMLREALSDLEDAQDELLEHHEKAALEAAAAGEPKPKPKPVPVPVPVPIDPDAPKPATTLTGPDLPEPAPQPTTLTGPDLTEPAPPPSTLSGPDLKESPKPATTLTGPDLTEPAPPPSTLSGPDVPDEPPPPSTLGDDIGAAAPGAPGEPAGSAANDAADAKRPWWRRPFG